MHRLKSTPLFPRPLAAAALLLALPLLATEPPVPSDGPFTVAGPLQGVVLQPLAEGLGALTSITHAGDDRLFLTTKDGLLFIFENGAPRPEPFLDLRGQVSTESEQGLLSVAFHPDYAENGLFFIDYTDLTGSVIVARYQVSADDPNRADPASARILLNIAKTTMGHNGGQLQFGPDGYLYVAVGDNAGKTPDIVCAAQMRDSLLGKLLRLDVDNGADAPPYYSIPFDNPFRGSGTTRDEVWAMGFRNPWRFSFDSATGDLWLGDVGQSTREEVDFQPAGSPGGQNYGWKVMEGSNCFRSTFCPADTPPCASPVLTPPVLQFEHGATGCSVTGGYVYRGSRMPQLHGLYLFADFCTGKIWGAERVGDTLRVRELGSRAPLVTAFGQDRNGELLVATISGRLFRLVPRGPIDSVAAYNPAAARFFFRNLHLGGAADRSLIFGAPGSDVTPLAGDWNGDGRSTIGIWDPATNRFQLKNSLNRGPAEISFVLAGRSGVIPLAGDWDGNGRDSVGYYDPASSTFQLRNAFGAGRFDITFRFGTAGRGWLPVVGDWDGDGDDTIGLYDPATSTFHLKNRYRGTNDDLTIQFGPQDSTWLPFAGDWDGDGRDSLALFDPATSVFRLKNALQSGTADHIFRFGAVGGGWLPLAGEW